MTTEKEGCESINRRDFIVRTSQFGLALSMLPPQVAELLRNSATAPAELAAFASALRWRMIGPFHRVVWEPVIPPPPPPAGATGGGGFGRGEGTRIAGSFTAKLTANGKTYSQAFTVLPDPRVASPRATPSQ